MLSIGVDTGGTFTDFVVFDEEAGRLRVAKVASVPSDPTRAFMNGLAALEVDLSRVRGVDGVSWAVPLYKGNAVIRSGQGLLQQVILMGLDDAYRLPTSETNGLKVVGDGVSVPVVRWLGQHLLAPLAAGRSARAAA